MRTAVMLVALALLSVGCAAVPYTYGAKIEASDTLRLRPNEAQIVRGRPHERLDWIADNIFGLPGKLLLWNRRVDNHAISPETEAALRDYLDRNDLRQVKVRLNQYDPSDELRRLENNRAIHAGWRYTLGLITVLSYAILPGRLFGGDNYNPYTNTINLYSDHPSIALHEAAHAKDFAQRKWKGGYAALRILPIVPLFQEGIASGDVIGYHRAERAAGRERADYKVLYPAYSTYIVGEGLQWVDAGGYAFFIQLAASLPAHAVGRYKAAHVREENTGN